MSTTRSGPGRRVAVGVLLAAGLVSALVTASGLFEPRPRAMTPGDVRTAFEKSEAADRAAWEKANPGRLGPPLPYPTPAAGGQP